MARTVTDAEIGQRVKVLRGSMPQRHVVTVLQMVHRITWYPATIARVEAGKRALKLTEAVALARIFGVQVDALVSEQQPQGPRSADAVQELTEVLDYVTSRIEKLEA